MSLGLRNEYLSALGIDVWVPRSTGAPGCTDGYVDEPAKEEIARDQKVEHPAGVTGLVGDIVIGPGNSNTLLLCSSADEAATVLAADIARSLDCEPVWSWPVQGTTDQGIPLAQAIEERLFTRLVVFGHGLLGNNGETGLPLIRSARIIQAESIPVLARNGLSRKVLWQQLSDSNWCASVRVAQE